jgi:alkylation response protein AidB-like acyl-CoA dehydrogenase
LVCSKGTEMDFEYTEEQKTLKSRVRDFLEKEIAPVVDERDRQGPFSREELVGYIKKLMPFGYYIGGLPREYGGPGIDFKTQGILIEECYRIWPSLTAAIGVASTIISILQTASGELLEKMNARFLPRILEGDLLGCVAITEPNVGSDAARITTTAVLEGDDCLINGTKTWISNGTIVDCCVPLCVMKGDTGQHMLSNILVERVESPWEAREMHKLGWRACPTAELFFTDCRVPRVNLIEPGRGYKRTMELFEFGRSSMAAMGAGVSQAAVDAAIEYARDRNRFGRPIGSFQMIQEMIADMIAETEAMRLLAFRAMDLLDKGVRTRWESSLAKAYASEAAVRVTSKGIQIHGALGLSEQYPMERYYRDARMLTIPDGTTQIQKLVVGREHIGIKAFA